ncbi:hypothetical protein [Arhodomonas sp. AD133]|uniref:hypothetical protein n=1 Tax=Arhodomonas sp. AD133 TaxID=3415009 RepID=UPI003EC0B65D
MPWNVLLLPLLGGYFFAVQHPVIAYRTERLSRERLLLESALYGLALVVIAYAVTRVGIAVAPALAAAWKSAAPWPYSGTTVGALLLGVGGGAVVRRALSAERIEAGVEKWLNRTGNELERLLYRSATRAVPIMVTLRNGKVYVGDVIWVPTHVREAGAYFVLVPLMSGYRRNPELTVEFTTFYDEAVEALLEQAADERERAHMEARVAELGHVIPADEVVTASVFDPSLYGGFHGGRL